jgi:hypothetical protein
MRRLRKMFRFAFAIAAMVMAGLCAPSAFAQNQPSNAGRDSCFDAKAGRMPSQVVFADGNRIRLVARDDLLLTYLTVLPGGAQMEMTTLGGLFTLKSRNLADGAERIFRWDQDLSRFFPLRIGLHIRAKAVVMQSESDRTSHYAVDAMVLGAENLRIGSCDYMVLKIDLQDANGMLLTRYVSPDLLLTMRTLISYPATAQAPARTVEHRVIALE